MINTIEKHIVSTKKNSVEELKCIRHEISENRKIVLRIADISEHLPVSEKQELIVYAFGKRKGLNEIAFEKTNGYLTMVNLIYKGENKNMEICERFGGYVGVSAQEAALIAKFIMDKR